MTGAAPASPAAALADPTEHHRKGGVGRAVEQTRGLRHHHPLGDLRPARTGAEEREDFVFTVTFTSVRWALRRRTTAGLAALNELPSFATATTFPVTVCHRSGTVPMSNTLAAVSFDPSASHT